MKIAVVGGGFTGLSAALKLSRRKHNVTLFESQNFLGGLASTFSLPGWQWSIEKHYHHWFTNDTAALNLIRDLGLEKYLLFPETLTAVYYQGRIYPFNSPSHILSFPPLSFPDRLRTGLATVYLKLLSKKGGTDLERYTAYDKIKKFYGEKSFRIIWKPLLEGKFGRFAKEVNMAWFWARIKKRTLRLGYLQGGYQKLVDSMAQNIRKNGGRILLGTPFDPKQSGGFDKVILTVPSPLFIRMFPGLPPDYKNRLLSIPHLTALNLLLITKEKFLNDVYWLNINDRSFPFIAVIQHTNLADSKYYGGSHLTWVANYLPVDHPFLKMSKEEVFNAYLPHLKKINPSFNFQSSVLNSQLFNGPFAQPVFPVNYSRIVPGFKTPLKNIYLANMDMVYPWDRGTNYAIEMGQEVAEIVLKPDKT